MMMPRLSGNEKKRRHGSRTRGRRRSLQSASGCATRRKLGRSWRPRSPRRSSRYIDMGKICQPKAQLSML